MKTCVQTLIAVCCITISCSAYADAPKPEQVPTKIRVANEVDKYEADIRMLDRQFAHSFVELREAYAKQRQSLRGKVSKKLSSEQKKLTQEGNLDRAVEVRDQIQSIKTAEIIMPNFMSEAGNALEGQASDKSILGSWRWNNGVDITNFDRGRMSGRGTWQLVDGDQKIYQFNWSKIAPDRVRLSPNGRVLEGTKAADPTFRVWAVRID